MLDQKDIQHKALAVRRELQARLGVRGRDLPHALRRAGRRLPKAVRLKGDVLTQADFFARNPKMARRLDRSAVQAAYDVVMAHLKTVNVKENRKDRLLGIAGSIAFNLLFVVVAFIGYLWWRGFV
jgi:hypothetical protein|tara:strand:+ start:453 stop:827 length:375 start_codon:yes stop_codon:yes gene_type:complete